jgi:hypothetical protein
MALDGFFDAEAAVGENRVPVITPFKKVKYSHGLTASPTTLTAKRIYLGTVPAGSIISAVWYRKVTSFDAAGNDYLTVGSVADDDLIANDIDISSAAATIPARYASTELPYYTATDLDVYASYVYS